MLTLALLLSVVAAPAHLRVVPERDLDQALSDEELVLRTLREERLAANQLVARHIPSVFASVRRLLGPTDDAEDAVQDAFYEALRDLRRLKEPSSFGAWVKKIAVHQVHRRFRRRKILRVLGLLSSTEDQALSPFLSVQSDPSTRVQLRELDDLLARQSPSDRLAWMLRHVEGLSLLEVAATTETSLATVKRKVARVQATVIRTFGHDVFEENQA